MTVDEHPPSDLPVCGREEESDVSGISQGRGDFSLLNLVHAEHHLRRQSSDEVSSFWTERGQCSAALRLHDSFPERDLGIDQDGVAPVSCKLGNNCVANDKGFELMSSFNISHLCSCTIQISWTSSLSTSSLSRKLCFIVGEVFSNC